jgi:hypothetical protein
MSKNTNLQSYSNIKTELLIRDSVCILVVHIYNPDPTNLSLLKTRLQEQWGMKCVRLPLVNWRKTSENTLKRATHLPLSASNYLIVAKKTIAASSFQFLTQLFNNHGMVLLFGRQNSTWFDTSRFIQAPKLEAQKGISLIKPLVTHYTILSPTEIIKANLHTVIRLLDKAADQLK